MLSGITYSDFSDPSGLNLMNNAQIAEGNILRLTPAVGGMEGAAWYTDDKPYVSVDWETTFEFNLNENQDSPGGSDGFVFIVQNHAPTYLRGGGGTLGYFELPNSLAVEFDTFQNSEANDPSQSHISIHTNGTDEIAGKSHYPWDRMTRPRSSTTLPRTQPRLAIHRGVCSVLG